MDRRKLTGGSIHDRRAAGDSPSSGSGSGVRSLPTRQKRHRPVLAALRAMLEGSPTRPSLFLAPSFMIRMASCILGRSGGGDLPAVIGWTAGAVNPRPLRHSASTHRKRAVEGRSSAFFGCWALAGRAGWRDFFSLLFAFAICPLASSSPPMAASHGFSWLLMPLPLLRLVAREPVLILRHFLTPYQGSPPAINHFQPSPLRRRQQRRADQDEPSRGPTLRTHIDRRWLQNYKAHGF
ncbi:hypothetical protein A7C99_0935 [Trichophyton rubrum]|uniref:Uncharacterized protein n=1 Tax=Trichophyton rubrum TaxID=5551 RepID=A0A178F6V6_TRIRU|nr:hypothetical protein A7C99_0935 [Trichophyton rubrum]